MDAAIRKALERVPADRFVGADDFAAALADRTPGSLSWAGLRNTHSWVDPDSGIGVRLLFQLLPFYDSAVMAVLEELEGALYERLRAR